jgi:hypothetical protein
MENPMTYEELLDVLRVRVAERVGPDGWYLNFITPAGGGLPILDIEYDGDVEFCEPNDLPETDDLEVLAKAVADSVERGFQRLSQLSDAKWEAVEKRRVNTK